MRSVSLSLTGIEAARQLFGPSVVHQALNSTLNKLAAQGKTAVSKEIRKTYNIKARDLNAQMTISKARPGAFESEIGATGPRISLMYFDPEQVTLSGGDAIITKRARGKSGSGGLYSRKVKRGSRVRGVTVKVRNDRGRKLLRGENHFGGFIAQGRRGLLGGGNARALFNRSEGKQGRGNFQVFMRTEKDTWVKGTKGKRTPIEKVTGPAVPQMLGWKASVVQDFIKNESARIFQHELDFFAARVRNRG
jgi:hypothetical protein